MTISPGAEAIGSSIAEQRALDLLARRGRLDDHARVVASGSLDRAVELLLARALVMPTLEPRRAGFTQTGRPKPEAIAFQSCLTGPAIVDLRNPVPGEQVA